VQEQTSYSSRSDPPSKVRGKIKCVRPFNKYESCPALPASKSHGTPTNQHRAIGKRKTIVIVAEGAHDAALNPIRADYVKDVLTERLSLDTRVTTLGHTQRGGRPCAFDRILVSCLCLFQYAGHS